MSQHFDYIVMTVSGTPGTGNITHGAAVAGFRALAATVDGVATNGLNFDLELYEPSGPHRSVEVNCAYNSGTGVITRGTVASSTTGSRLSLTSAAIISVTNHATLGNKLEGIAPGATANSSDAALINRANHTGTQPASTISDFVGSVLFSNLNSVETPITDSTITASDTVLTGFRKLIQRFAEYRTIARTWTAAQRSTIVTLADGATITPDFSASSIFTVTLGGNRLLGNPTSVPSSGVTQSGCIFIVQPGSGGPRTLNYDSSWDFAGGTPPTLSTAANAVDRLDYIVRTSTSIHAVLTKAWS
jgi:hypothetical protein